jgi:hypothetical protein
MEEVTISIFVIFSSPFTKVGFEEHLTRYTGVSKVSNTKEGMGQP